MPNTTPLTDAINALTTYANETTGASDTTLSDAVGTLVDGYGGGGMGGLANMVDVSTQDYEFAYMLSCMKNGATAGGTVTYASAFPNTETKILETGLATVHGFLFCRTDTSIEQADGQTNVTIFVFVKSDDTINAVGLVNANAIKIFNQAQGTVQQNAPLNGAIRVSGGDIYYTGRYNNNASYQMLKPNIQYEWLAW